MPTQNSIRIKGIEPQIVADFLAGVNRKEILVKHQIAGRTLITILNRNGVKLEKANGGGKLNDSEKDIIDAYLGGESSISLADRYNTTVGGISYLLKRNSIETRSQSVTSRKYALNESFFDEIDSEEKAYFLGMLYADGCNMEKRGSVALALHEKDRALLERLNRLVYQDRPLYYLKPKSVINANRSRSEYTCAPCYRIVIESNHVSKRLAQLGCTERKTTTLQFPHWIAPELMHHFVRGFFDGDGSAYFNKASISGHASVIASIDFIAGLKRVLELYCDVKSVIKKPEYESVRTLIISGKENLLRFSNFIYENSTIQMERKRLRLSVLSASPIGKIKETYFRTIYGQ